MNAVLRARVRSENGMVLVVALIILLVLSILVVAETGDATLQQHMAGNYASRQIAFQAAEAGLREGEAKAASLAGNPGVFIQGQTAGLYGPDASLSPLSKSQWSATDSIAGTTIVLPNGIDVRPRYVIQLIHGAGGQLTQLGGYGLSAAVNQSTTLFAVTAHASSPRGGQVVLRSYYRAGSS